MTFHQARAVASMLLATAFLFVLPVSGAHAQGDGPRAYQLIPDGTRILALYGFFTRGNQSADPGTLIQGSHIDVNLGVLQYTHTFAVAGRQAAVFGVLPFGEVDGSLTVPGRTLSDRSSGIGDFQLGGILGLIGSPALSAKEYAAYQPGFALGALGKVLMPTGEYDA